MYDLFLIIHVVISFALIGLVLLQQGKTDMGTAFGGGASQTLFGSSGAANFFTRTTAIFATCFFLTSLTLSYLAVQSGKHENAANLSRPKVIENEQPSLSDS